MDGNIFYSFIIQFENQFFDMHSIKLEIIGNILRLLIGNNLMDVYCINVILCNVPCSKNKNGL